MHDVKRWLVVGQLLAAFAAQGQDGVAETKPAPETRADPRANAVVIALWGGGSLGGSLGVTTSVGIEFEHRFGSVGISLGVGGGASVDSAPWGGATFSAAIEPGARIYLPGAGGAWLGSGVYAGYASSTSQSLAIRSWMAGLTPAVGYTHAFDSGLVVQLSVGPQVQLSWTNTTAF